MLVVLDDAQGDALIEDAERIAELPDPLGDLQLLGHRPDVNTGRSWRRILQARQDSVRPSTPTIPARSRRSSGRVMIHRTVRR